MYDASTDSGITAGKTKRGSADERVFPVDAGADIGEGVKVNALDTPAVKNLHRRLMGFFHQELQRQDEPRRQMALDEDYYDNIQWSEDDAAVLRERGQNPIAYNVLSQTINWIIGSEKRGRTDFKVYPRRKDEGKAADNKSQLMKYVADVNRRPFHRSRAFEDAVKVGIGWLEDTLNGEMEEGEIIASRYESWRNMIYDSAATNLDLSDARYIIRHKWLDVDLARTLVPERAHIVDQSAVDGFALGGDIEDGDDPMDSAENARILAGGGGGSDEAASACRKRVRVLECWFRRPTKVQRFVDGPLKGHVFEDDHPYHQELVQMGAMLAERSAVRMYVCLMTLRGVLWLGRSPFRHNGFPFTPIFAYRRGRDNMPYGYIRGLRDIQDDINKRASKSLAILSSNKVIMDEGAVEDEAEMREELADPNGVIRKRRGYALEINADRDLATGHMELFSRGIQMIQQAGGVTDEMMGRATNAQSGRAVLARQDQGILATSKVFDNLRFAEQVSGEKILSMIEQFFSEEKQFRITNERGRPDFVTINDGLPENDIVRTKADFVIGEAEWRVTMRQSANAQLTEMMTRLPEQVVMAIIDLVVEGMDVENREEIVNRIRQITGQKDPDADDDQPPTEEELLRQQQEAEAMRQQQEIMEAQKRELQANAAKAEASASKEQAAAINARVDAQGKAINIAREIQMTPGVAPAVDAVLAEAGWTDQQAPGQPTPEQAAAAEAEAIALQQQQQQQQQQAELAAQQAGGMQPDAAGAVIPTEQQPPM